MCFIKAIAPAPASVIQEMSWINIVTEHFCWNARCACLRLLYPREQECSEDDPRKKPVISRVLTDFITSRIAFTGPRGILARDTPRTLRSWVELRAESLQKQEPIIGSALN